MPNYEIECRFCKNSSLETRKEKPRLSEGKYQLSGLEQETKSDEKTVICLIKNIILASFGKWDLKKETKKVFFFFNFF